MSHRLGSVVFVALAFTVACGPSAIRERNVAVRSCTAHPETRACLARVEPLPSEPEGCAFLVERAGWISESQLRAKNSPWRIVGLKPPGRDDEHLAGPLVKHPGHRELELRMKAYRDLGERYAWGAFKYENIEAASRGCFAIITDRIQELEAARAAELHSEQQATSAEREAADRKAAEDKDREAQERKASVDRILAACTSAWHEDPCNVPGLTDAERTECKQECSKRVEASLSKASADALGACTAHFLETKGKPLVACTINPPEGSTVSGAKLEATRGDCTERCKKAGPAALKEADKKKKK